MTVTVIITAAIIRYLYVYEWHRPESYVFSDMKGYLSTSQAIVASKHGARYYFQPIGYPLILAAVQSLGWIQHEAIKLIHLLTGVGTVLFVWRASRWWLGAEVGRAALLLATFHLPFVMLSGFFLTETIYSFLLAAMLYLLARLRFPWRAGHALTLGITYGVGGWFKGLNVFFAPILLLWAILWIRRRSRAEICRGARALMFFAVGSGMVFGAHGAFSYFRDGEVLLSASAGGLNFVEGKCPSKNNRDSRGSRWHSPLFVQLGEVTAKTWPRPFYDQAFFWLAGWECVRQRPLVLLTSLRYVHYLFFDNELWPTNVTKYRAASRYYAMFYSLLIFPGIVIGVLRLSRRPRSHQFLPVLVALSLVFCVWLMKSELRFRVPFDVVFLPLSVLGWTTICAALRSDRDARRCAASPAIAKSLPTVRDGVSSDSES
jgi:4-amino-4-deoxy-L-arabinose transferase-like glycosyltransferase